MLEQSGTGLRPGAISMMAARLPSADAPVWVQ